MTLFFNEFHFLLSTTFVLLIKMYVVFAKRYWRSSATIFDFCWFFLFSIEFSMKSFKIFVFERRFMIKKTSIDRIQICWRIFSFFFLISIQLIDCLIFMRCEQFSNKWINSQTHCLSTCFFWLNFDLFLFFSIVFWFCC